MKLKLKETVVFALLGTVMFVSKLAMEALPNIHLLATLIITYTVVYRYKAIYPITVFILLEGIVSGFTLWWIPYLYIWQILWAVTLLLPKNMKPKVAIPVYMVTAAMHGFLYGTLYAPFQALAFGMDFKGTLAWIAAGFPFDITHGISNFFCALLVIPLAKSLRRAEKH